MRSNETQPEHSTLLFSCLQAVSNQAGKLCIGSNSLFPVHGRQPNFNQLMKGSLAPAGAPVPRAAGRTSCQDEDDPSYSVKLGRDALLYFRDPSFNIIEKPYVYLFNGRKWPHTIQYRVVCESGCADIRHPSHKEVLHCSRYEVAGTPVVIERYRFSNCATSICRMVCCPATPLVDARRGDAVHQLQGMGAQAIAQKFWTSPTSLISAVEGLSDRSWSHAFANQIGETSDSSAATTSSIVSTGGCTSSVGTPSRSEWVFGNMGTLSSPEPQISALAMLGLGHPTPAPAAVFTPTQVQHLNLVKDLFTRETRYAPDRNGILNGWRAWRTGDLANLERYAVVKSISRIISYSDGSRCATHLCVALLDLFIGISAQITNGIFEDHTRRHLKLLVMGCVLVGTKVADLFPPAVHRLAASMTEDFEVDRFTINLEITGAEMDVLQTLRYDVHPPTLDEAVETVLELRFNHTTARDPSSRAAREVASKPEGHNDMLNIGSIYASRSSVNNFVAHLHAFVQNIVTTARYLADLVLRDPAMLSFPVSSVGLAIVEYATLSCAFQFSRAEEMWELNTLAQWNKYMSQYGLTVSRDDAFHLEVRENCPEGEAPAGGVTAEILTDISTFMGKLPSISPQYAAAYELFRRTCAERGSDEAGRVFDMVIHAHVLGRGVMDADLTKRFEKMWPSDMYQYSLSDVVVIFGIDPPTSTPAMAAPSLLYAEGGAAATTANAVHHDAMRDLQKPEGV